MALHYEIVTPEKLVRSADAWMVVVPGNEGDVGVMTGHAPIMTLIREGALHIYASDGAEPELLPISGGFAHVDEKGLTILADSVGEQA